MLLIWTTKTAVCLQTKAILHPGVVIEWTWRWYVYYFIHKGRNLLSVVYLTCQEIVKSRVSRVNNDVTLGLTTGHWSTL